MYRVLIVDDEKQILDGLTKMIKWSEFGFEICATARNGREALGHIKRHRPHLVLTDIRMPEMDGISLLEFVNKSISSEIEFIILSGYSEFEYARQALRYNVKNYILKPIDEAILYKTLLDIKDVLDEKELRQSERIRTYINNIIMGDRPDSELVMENEVQYGLRFMHIIRHKQYGVGARPKLEDDANIPKLGSIISTIIGSDNMRFVAKKDKDNLSIVVGLSILSRFDFCIEGLAQGIREDLRINKSTDVDILIGKKVDEFCKLHESIQSISKCINKRFYTDGPSIISFDDIEDETFSNIFDDKGAVVKIITAFRKGDMDKVVAGTQQLVEHFVVVQAAPELVLIHLDSIMTSVLQILNERLSGICEIAELYNSFKKNQDRLNIYEFGRQTIEFCRYCNEFASRKSKHRGETLNKVISFVDNHFTEPIKIVDIAEHFYINPAYLGQQFIKKKGCSLNQYLNTLRIDRSKELLKNTSLRIYEIAEKVGFDDPNYFSVKFYDHTKQTPSDFRNA